MAGPARLFLASPGHLFRFPGLYGGSPGRAGLWRQRGRQKWRPTRSRRWRRMWRRWRPLAPEPAVPLAMTGARPSPITRRCCTPRGLRAVAGLSVPFSPPSPTPFIEVAEALYADRFFYQNYFQAPGVAEQELEADPEDSLARIYFSLSGDAPGFVAAAQREGAGLLENLPRPEPFPAWMGAEDLAVRPCLSRRGLSGPLNRYRAQRLMRSSLRRSSCSSLAASSGGAGRGAPLYPRVGSLRRSWRRLRGFPRGYHNPWRGPLGAAGGPRAVQSSPGRVSSRSVSHTPWLAQGP